MQDIPLDRIERQSLQWFGHLIQMFEDRLPKNFKRVPVGKCKRGRPHWSWNEVIRQAMESQLRE